MRFFLVAAATVCVGEASAYDLGDPWFDPDPEAPRHRLEGGIVWADADSTVVDQQVFAGPIGAAMPDRVMLAPTTIERSGNFTYGQLRWVYRLAPDWSTQLQLGFTGSEDEYDGHVYLGGAVRANLFSDGPLGVAAQLSAHGVPEYAGTIEGVTSTGEVYRGIDHTKTYGGSAALLGSVLTHPTERLRLLSYIGPVLAMQRDDYRSVVDVQSPTSPDLRLWVDGSDDTDPYLGGVLGVRVDWNRRWYTRLEANVGERQNFALGVSGVY